MYEITVNDVTSIVFELKWTIKIILILYTVEIEVSNDVTFISYFYTSLVERSIFISWNNSKVQKETFPNF